MQVCREQNVIERSGDFQESEFKIKTSSKAFHILSSQLYQNKIAAIVRELSCNAFDAHRAAGNPNTFAIHVPNRAEPWFAIRDYGLGLREDQVIGPDSIYTTYFESTKEDSNDYVGCLGLGSKSPFAYSDSFTITSYHSGTKWVYSAFVSEDGKPRVAMLSCDPTDLPNGLEINVPVKFGDVSQWQLEIGNFFKFFSLLPEFSGGQITIPKEDYILEGKDWKVVSREYQPSLAIMGGVAYPINHQLPCFSGTHLFFEIGELDVTPSREGLSYDKQTVANLEARAKRVRQEQDASFGAKILAADSLREARATARVIERRFGWANRAQTFNGHQIWPSHFESKTAAIIRVTKRAYGRQQVTERKIHELAFEMGQRYYLMAKNCPIGRARLAASSDSTIYLIPTELKADFEGWLGEEIESVEVLPKPAARPRNATPRCPGRYVDADGISEDGFSVRLGGYYLVSDQRSTLLGAETNLSQWVDLAGVNRVWLVTPGRAVNLATRSNWVNFCSVAIEAAQKEYNKKPTYYNSLSQNYHVPDRVSYCNVSGDNDFVNFVALFKKHVHADKPFWLNLVDETEGLEYNIDEEWAKITTKYPLVGELAEEVYGFSKLSHLSHYIELVEKHG